MDRYEMEELEDTFADHGERAMKSHEEMIREFKEAYPEEPLPEHLRDAFCLPLALQSMVQEIIRLRADMEALTDDVHGWK